MQLIHLTTILYMYRDYTLSNRWGLAPLSTNAVTTLSWQCRHAYISGVLPSCVQYIHVADTTTQCTHVQCSTYYTRLMHAYCKSRNFNGHFNLMNEKDVKLFDLRMRTYTRSSCTSSLDFYRGFEALPGPAGQVLPRLLLLLALFDQLQSIHNYV